MSHFEFPLPAWNCRKLSDSFAPISAMTCHCRVSQPDISLNVEQKLDGHLALSTP